MRNRAGNANKKMPPTENGRGIDVSSVHVNSLDRAVLRQIRKGRSVRAVELGGGAGAQALRMAEAGAEVWMVDLAGTARAQFNRAARKNRLHLVQKDFTALKDEDLPQGFDVLYSQRSLHYLRHAEARGVLSDMFRRMAKGGRAYISVAGTGTPFAAGYPARDNAVEDRFACLAPEMREAYAARQPMTLYREEELKDLLKSAGFHSVKTRTTRFGMVEARAVK